jgi:hypothetical protein
MMKKNKENSLPKGKQIVGHVPIESRTRLQGYDKSTYEEEFFFVLQYT